MIADMLLVFFFYSFAFFFFFLFSFFFFYAILQELLVHWRRNLIYSRALSLMILSLRIQGKPDKIYTERKRTISLLNIYTKKKKNKIPMSVINVMQYNVKRYPEFDKNKLHKWSMVTKTNLQVLHDFW